MRPDEDGEYEVVQRYEFPDTNCCIEYDLDDEQHIVFKPEPESK